MIKRILIAIFMFFTVFSQAYADEKHPHAVILMTQKMPQGEISLGQIEIELDSNKAPISVKNFVDYANSGFYNGTLFHRIIPGFMIQGGGFITGMQEKPTRPPIKNESENGLRNLRGTLAMARTAEKDSATSQFFINVVDNSPLDYSHGNPGYAVFGKVIKGMDVIDRIAAMPTHTFGYHGDVPVNPIIISSIKMLQ